MSLIVLKNKMSLELPQNYVGIEVDEMEYIDGGADDWKYYIGGVATGVAANILTEIGKVSITALKGMSTAAIGGSVFAVVLGVAVGYGVVKYTNAMLKQSKQSFYNSWVTVFNSHRYCCHSMKIGQH